MLVLEVFSQNDRPLARGKTRAESRFWAHFGLQPTGMTLIRESGTWSLITNPLQTRLAAADDIRDANGEVVKGYFLGGHKYVVSDATIAELYDQEMGYFTLTVL